MDNENKITIKQQKFADLYIISGNATQSYIDAGYKATTRKVAEANARRLLVNERVQLYISERMETLKKSTIASQEEILEFLTRVIRGEEKDQFDLDASLQDKLKSAELLGKRYGTWVEKKDVNANLNQEIKVTLIDD